MKSRSKIISSKVKVRFYLFLFQSRCLRSRFFCLRFWPVGSWIGGDDYVVVLEFDLDCGDDCVVVLESKEKKLLLEIFIDECSW